MTPDFMRLAGLAILSAALSTPAFADSLASSASSAGSASLGSISGSSNSSSPAKQTAEGDYRVIEVAEVTGQPGMLRLQLQATPARDGDGPIWLTLPQQALAQKAIVPGDIVSARQRPYGIEFARGAANAPDREAFLLVLADNWVGELAPRAVKL